MTASAGKTSTKPRQLVLITRTYPPAVGAVGDLVEQLAQAMAACGWQVEVIASRCSLSPPVDNRDAQVRVHHIWSPPVDRRSPWRRALSVLAFYPLALLKALRIARRGAVVVTTTDPPLQLVIGALLQIVRPVHLVHWSQDVYPEVAETLGALRAGSCMANSLRTVARWALERHARVVVIGRCMQKRLAAFGVDGKRLAIIENWPDAQILRLPPDMIETGARSMRRAFGLEEKFVVMYSGNFGLAHPLEIVLAAAKLLSNEPDIGFVLVGEGPRRQALERQARELGLANVHFLRRQPRQQLAALLGAADLHVAVLDPALAGLVVPSKIYNVLAAGRPCLFLGPGESEAACLLQESAAGQVLEQFQAPLLADAILEWKSDAPGRRAAGQQARACAARFSQEQALEKWARLLEEAAGLPGQN